MVAQPSGMLSYCNTMFLDVLHSDGLVVSAKGLGVEHVIFNLIQVYSDPGNLVLVMGLSDEEEAYYRSRLQSTDAKAMPKKVTSEYSSVERQRLYKDGGVLFVTTRILVVDMLTDKIPMDLITGIIVTRAHKTAESCQEAFILRMYRQKNRTGFIKAFSCSPLSFTTGFCQVERVMRGLFVRNLYLWPRFHKDVVATIAQARAPEVIEVHVHMTKDMETIQTAVLDLLNFSMQELRRLNPSLVTEETTEGTSGGNDLLAVENAISRSFYKLLQRELNPVWHQLSWKTKQLVSDMKTLHNVLVHLTQYDCVTFQALISTLRTADNAVKSGGWMILDAADTLFVTAKARVFGMDANAASGKNLLAVDADDLEVKCEENPKWRAFTEVLEEIKEEVDSNAEQFPTEKVLVLASDERVAHQLQDVMDIGPKTVLVRMFNRSLGERHGYLAGGEAPVSADPPAATAGSKRFKHIKDKGKGKKSKPQEQPQDEGEKTGIGLLKSPLVIIQSMSIGSFALFKLINEMKPRYIVLYDVDVSVIRQLETFQASQQDFTIKTFIIIYKNSVEEQAYLTSIRKEKEAFERLIREKATMVIPEDRDGRMGHNPDLLKDTSSRVEQDDSSTDNTSSRHGASQKAASQDAKVIVDMREFRSELPSLLHKRGIDIEPVTIEVGDYILTPEICVERKSISDLIGSLNSGRLYNQATSMTRFYAKPMLLIEFDAGKPFALQGKYYLSRDVASSDLTARLQLLTMHFPKLRILWSPSPHATAELFEEMSDDPSCKLESCPLLLDTKDLVDEEGFNIQGIKCKYCSSKIIPPKTAKYLEMSEKGYQLHIAKAKADPDKSEYEELKQFWVVSDMFDFDNVGFSHTVEGVKYLVCADCERGPIGYHDTNGGNKNCHVALARVTHTPDY